MESDKHAGIAGEIPSRAASRFGNDLESLNASSVRYLLATIRGPSELGAQLEEEGHPSSVERTSQGRIDPSSHDAHRATGVAVVVGQES